MKALEIKRPVLVKVIITKGFKEQIVQESREAITNIDKDLETIKNIPASEDTKRQTEYLNSLKEDFQRKIKDFDVVKEGQELPFKTLEGIAKLEVGDNLLEKLTQTEVVIKDWIIQEIRHD
ncbi:MAG: YlqD family protein [Armatimonadota bacterium]